MSQIVIVDVAACVTHCDTLQLLQGAGHGNMHCSSAAQGALQPHTDWHVAGLVERTVRLGGAVSHLFGGWHIQVLVLNAHIALHMSCITQAAGIVYDHQIAAWVRPCMVDSHSL